MRIFFWTQKASMQKGTFVAIYITAPTKAIRYLCQVLEANIANQGYRDEGSIKELMRIKPLYSFNDSDFDSERLKVLWYQNCPRSTTYDR